MADDAGRCVRGVRGLCEGDEGAAILSGAPSGQFCRRKDLPQYTSIGSYTIRYVMSVDGADLCARCVSALVDASMACGPAIEVLPFRSHVKTEQPTIFYETYDEGPPLVCERCYRIIESSYGEDRTVN